MLKERRKYIGVFDSGFGGINILRGIVKELPNYNYIYLGDTARTPYGTRSKEVVYDFAKQAVDFLFAKNCGLVYSLAIQLPAMRSVKFSRNIYRSDIRAKKF